MAPAKVKKKCEKRLSNAERSAYFARREAAKVLRAVLQGDAQRRALGSIKSLVYSPSIRNKKATFALVCQTLKCLRLIKDVLDAASVLSSRWKKQEELVYIITYDILFGKEISSYGTAEKFLLLRQDALQAALARILIRMNVKRVEDLPFLEQFREISKPRYVRVNTLKLDVESAVNIFGEQFMVQKDDMVQDLLILPSGSDLHNHPLVTDGRVFLQGKASSMVAAALEPQPGWQVLDACSAPGNKTTHLAALMKGKGKIIACELHAERAKILVNTVRMAGATSILSFTPAFSIPVY
ncbi:Putative 28S rRNA (cytosine-C(5))-methyltransferase [Dionaea muscipula]